MQVTFDSVQASALEKLQIKEALREEQLITKVLKRAQKSKMFEAWGLCLGNVVAVRLERHLLQRVLGRMSNRCLASSFSACASAWEELKIQPHRVDVYLLRKQTRELKPCGSNMSP